VSRHVEIRFVSPSCALVSGPGMREALTELTGVPPVWATISKGWVIQPSRAGGLVAVLEYRGGFDISVTSLEQRETATAASPADRPDPGAGLW